MVEADAASMLAIYRPYVERTVISFEIEVPTLEEYAARVRTYVTGWAGVVAEMHGDLVAYAYGSPHRDRPAYRWSVGTTVYVAPGFHRRGIGRRLYEALLPALASKGFCNAYAGVTLPNAASVDLHRAVGFQPIGTFSRVGFKFGQWRDVAWFQQALRARPPSSGAEGAA